MRTILTILAAATLLLQAACDMGTGVDRTGRGGPAQLVYAPPGTAITLMNASNGAPSETRLTVAPATGLRGAYTTDAGKTGGFYPGCWGCGGDAEIEVDRYAQLWPLEAGKNVAFLRTTPDGQKARVVIRVSGTQTVETPAGTFDTWILDGRIEHLTGPRYSAQVRAWWAQDPGWVVKAEGGDSQGSTLSSQVVGLRLP